MQKSENLGKIPNSTKLPVQFRKSKSLSFLLNQDTVLDTFYHSAAGGAVFRSRLYLAISPAQLDLVHPPQFVDVLGQHVSDVVQVRRQDDLQGAEQTEAAAGKIPKLIKLMLVSPLTLTGMMRETTRLSPAHLGGVDRSGDEGGLGEELGGPQHVTDPLVVSLVLLHGLNTHLFFGQQRLVARRVTSRWQELEVSMASSQQETNPGIRR